MMMSIDQLARGIASIVWRVFWKSIAGLVVFAQIAAASSLCLPERLPHESLALAGAAADDHHDLDSHCTGDAVPANQASASKVERPAADMGVPVVASWDVTPVASTPRVSYALIRAGRSLRLQFQNLRL
jgi:hypothetical protein